MDSSSRSDELRRLLRGGLLLFGVAAAGNAVGVWDLQRWVIGLPSLCVFHWLVGHDCPGCGMGRALVLLSHGRILASLHQHPFALPLLLWSAAWTTLPAGARARIERGWLVRSNAVSTVTVAALLLWWCVTKLA